MANDSDVRYAMGCSEMVTHAHFESKTSVTVYWTAPAAGSGCVSFKYVWFLLFIKSAIIVLLHWLYFKRLLVMQTETVWFKDDGELTKTICEDSK